MNVFAYLKGNDFGLFSVTQTGKVIISINCRFVENSELAINRDTISYSLIGKKSDCGKWCFDYLSKFVTDKNKLQIYFDNLTSNRFDLIGILGNGIISNNIASNDINSLNLNGTDVYLDRERFILDKLSNFNISYKTERAGLYGAFVLAKFVEILSIRKNNYKMYKTEKFYAYLTKYFYDYSFQILFENCDYIKMIKQFGQNTVMELYDYFNELRAQNEEMELYENCAHYKRQMESIQRILAEYSIKA